MATKQQHASRKMMHYRKGENFEKQLTKDELPFEDFVAKGSDFLWMHVNGGTKVTNVVNYAKNALDKGECKNVVWSGNGGGVVKTISCAEILKRSYPLYQVTRMCYTSVEEHWKPQMEGLEEIVANRQIPSLHIYMSLEPIEDSVSGLQKPNSKTDFWIYDPSGTGNHNTTGGGSSGPSNSNNRNQRQRNGGNSGQRRPQKSRPPQTTSNNEEPQSQPPSTANDGNSANNQQNKSNNASKRRRPHPNHNRGPKTQTNNSRTDNNASQQMAPMES